MRVPYPPSPDYTFRSCYQRGPLSIRSPAARHSTRQLHVDAYLESTARQRRVRISSHQPADIRDLVLTADDQTELRPARQSLRVGIALLCSYWVEFWRAAFITATGVTAISF